MKLITVIGARPQFIKAATVSRALRNFPEIDEIIVHTGQHYDKNISDIFFEELNIPEPKYNLNVGSGNHGLQTAKMLSGIEEILIKEKPDFVLVYGDTNSTTAGALAAVKLHIPVAHVEAGLRSFNRNMPEEINRIMTDAISDILFAPTQNAVDQLIKEGKSDVTFFSGDVMYDSVLYYKEKLKDKVKSELVKNLDEYYLCTIHRAENTDDPKNLKEIFDAFEEFGKAIVLPLHPRTRHKLGEYGLSVPKNVMVCEPVGYTELLSLLLGAQKMITDSGGVQKEAYFLQVPCVTLRNETEWIETLDNKWNILCGTDGSKILEALKSRPDSDKQNEAFGDGHSAEKIIEKMLAFKR